MRDCGMPRPVLLQALDALSAAGVIVQGAAVVADSTMIRILPPLGGFRMRQDDGSPNRAVFAPAVHVPDASRGRRPPPTRRACSASTRQRCRGYSGGPRSSLLPYFRFHCSPSPIHQSCARSLGTGGRQRSRPLGARLPAALRTLDTIGVEAEASSCRAAASVQRTGHPRP